MDSKTIAFMACLAVASAGLLPEKSYLEKLEENDSHASYEFAYNVDDLETGDVKSHRENRDGDNVQGQYTLNDADGYKRIVDYSVQGESGFNAVVRREPLQSILSAPRLAATTSRPIVAAPQPIVKSFVQPAPLLRTTVVHHNQPTLYHAPPAVHLAPPTHIVHSNRATTFVKSAPTVITTHHSPAVIHHSPAVIHHSPAVVHHGPTVVHHGPSAAVVHHHTPSIASPHHQVSYVHYH